MNRLTVTAIIAGVFIAGCASPPPPAQPVQSAEAAQQTTCTQVYRVGSMLPTTHCTTAAESEAERQQMIDTLRKQLPPGGAKASGGGG